MLAYIVKSFFWLISWLPQRARLMCGSVIGRFCFTCIPRRRAVIEQNITLCFPHLSQVQRQALSRETQENVGVGIFEWAMAWFRSDSYMRKIVRVDGFAEVRNAVNAGRGVLVVLPHFTHMTVVIRMCAMLLPIHLLHRVQGQEWVQQLSTMARDKHRCQSIQQYDMRRLLRVLQAGGIVVVLPDHDMGLKRSVFAPFFGVQAATVTSVAKLAANTGAAVIPVAMARSNDARYVMAFGAAFHDFPSGDAVADARQMNAVFESYIAQCPGQYYWCHRRFKTRPVGEAAIY